MLLLEVLYTQNISTTFKKRFQVGSILLHGVNLFSQLITVSGDQNVDFQNILSYGLSTVPLALFYPNGDMRKTSKSKILKEIEITEYSQLPLLGYQYASATVNNFMANLNDLLM